MATYDDEWLTATGWAAKTGAECTTGETRTPGAAAAIAKTQDKTNWI